MDQSHDALPGFYLATINVLFMSYTRLHYLALAFQQNGLICIFCKARTFMLYVYGSGPSYLSELILVYTPSRMHRPSTHSRILKSQHTNLYTTHGFRSFFPTLDLTFGIYSPLISGIACFVFKTKLKIFFFSLYFYPS